MTTSGTYNFGGEFANSDVVLEAFSRCQVRGPSLTGVHMADARRSLNLALQALSNKGINLFQLEQNVIQLIEGQATYQLPPEVVSISDAYYNIILNTGAGPDLDFPTYDPSQPIIVNDPQTVITGSIDRWLKPFGHDDYAMIAYKLIPGPPTSYWVNRLGPPLPLTITFYPVPFVGYPSAAVTYFALRMAQDANLPNNESPDVATRFYDWLCANLAKRLARKYAPQLIGAPGAGGLLDDETEAWALAASEDTEKSEVFIRPSMSAYWRV